MDDSSGTRVLWLRAAEVCVGLVPTLGGRVLSLVTAAGEHLFRSSDLLDDTLHLSIETFEVRDASSGDLGSWVNWGGDKTWPAPQGWSGPGEWPGPPDSVLDGGAYLESWTSDRANASVEMCSRDDLRTGLRVCRKVQVAHGTSGYRVTSTFTNVSDRVVRWAIWHVVQLPGSQVTWGAAADRGRGVWVGTEPGREAVVEDLLAGVGRVEVEQSCACVTWVPAQDVVGKVGFPGAAGWIAHAAAGRITALRFSPELGAAYPDRGSRAEVWLEYPLSERLCHLGGLLPRHRIVECEVLGPLLTMPPGSSTQLVTDVLGCSGEGPVSDVKAGACVLEPLVALADRSEVRVNGKIGVFCSGPITLSFLDRAEALLGEIPLGSVSGGTSFRVNVATATPAAAASVVVRLAGTVVACAPVCQFSERGA